jgi:hypothetical protein
MPVHGALRQADVKADDRVEPADVLIAAFDGDGALPPRT